MKRIRRNCDGVRTQGQHDLVFTQVDRLLPLPNLNSEKKREPRSQTLTVLKKLLNMISVREGLPQPTPTRMDQDPAHLGSKFQLFWINLRIARQVGRGQHVCEGDHDPSFHNPILVRGYSNYWIHGCRADIVRSLRGTDIARNRSLQQGREWPRDPFRSTTEVIRLQYSCVGIDGTVEGVCVSSTSRAITDL